jgi:hypothetical protein
MDLGLQKQSYPAGNIGARVDLLNFKNSKFHTDCAESPSPVHLTPHPLAFFIVLNRIDFRVLP